LDEPAGPPGRHRVDLLAARTDGRRRTIPIEEAAMSTNSPERAWKAWFIAVFAVVLAVAGGLSLFNKADGDAEPTTTFAANCSEFEANAHKLFDQGDTATLRGRFAPGDHVHLAIDFNGTGYSWEATGVLGKAPNLTRSRWFGWYNYTMNSKTTLTPSRTPISAESHGKISGFATLEVEQDVATVGDGTLTIKKISSVPSLISPRVVIASCKASNQGPSITRQLSS
jgi:hypothetical protein